MKIVNHKHARGLTIWEVVIVLAILGILALLLMTQAHRSRTPAGRIRCISNLKQVGLASRIWTGDHGDQLPAAVSTNEGGLSEISDQLRACQIFQILSNELSVPRVVVCPSDDERKEAGTFASLVNTNTSYFISLDAVDTRPDMMLAGDRNLSPNATVKKPTLLTGRQRLDGSRTNLGWTKAMHEHAGNVVLADGSAQQLTSETLSIHLQSDPTITNRVLFPN